MSLKIATSMLLAYCLLVGAMQPVTAESGQVLFSNWVTNGQMESANGCYLWFNITNNSISISVTVSRPGVPDDSIVLFPGQYKNYPGEIRVSLLRMDTANNKAFVEIVSLKSDSTPSGGTRLSCDTPGQTALAGDLVTFPVTITNNNDGDRTYTLSSVTDTGWNVRFTYADRGVYKVYVPKGQSRVINLEIQTTGNTPVSERKVIAKADDASLDLFVYITSVNQSVDVSTKVSSKIAAIGDKIIYDIRLKNLQSKENTYKLSVSGLPDSWYYRFKEDPSSTDEMAEVIVPSTSEKSLSLEIVPPYSVAEGEYNFTAIVTAPDGTMINRSFSLKLKSGSGMTVTSSKLAYDAKPGQTFDIDVYVTNSGRGSALTNVALEATAPSGWIVQVSPNRTNSIKAGEMQKFTISVMPPGNIVASDYEVSINVVSDQAEKEKDFRITIKTESYIPYIGGGIILLVLVGLVLMYRKYGRR